MEAKETIERFEKGKSELRTLPSVLTGILRITAGLDPDMNALEQEISRDPVIAGKIMKRANSSFYGRKVDNIRQAFLNVGWESVKAIALSTAVFDRIESWKTTLDRVQFWRHSFEVAVTSRFIARRLGRRCPETNYTIGLLHDIGILVLDQMNPDQYSEIFDVFMPDEDLAALEKQLLGSDHCEVGSELLRRWRLPDGVSAAIREHHNLCRRGYDDTNSAQQNPDAAILALADHISEMQIRPAEHGALRSTQRQHLLMKACALTREDIVEIKTRVAKQIAEESGYVNRSVGSPSELARKASASLRDYAADLIANVSDLMHGQIKRAESCLSPEEAIQVRNSLKAEWSSIERLWTNLQEHDHQVGDTEQLTQIESLNYALRDFVFRLSETVVAITCSAPADNQDDCDKYLLFYGTDRIPQYADDSNEVLVGYGEGSSKTLHLGTVTVHVPRHRKLGTLGSGPIGRMIWQDDTEFLEHTEDLPHADFWQRLTAELKAATAGATPDMLIYVHGYWNSFARAARRAAQLHIDLQVRGATAFYSWPSVCNPFGYVVDQEKAIESARHLRSFLSQIAQKCRPSNIHIIAHSMGNRALLMSIEKIADEVSQATGIPFAQIILAAPDITVDQFKAMADAYKKVSLRTTIYVSKKDRALGGSRLLRIRKADLLGLVPPVTTVDGMDTVEATRVDDTFLGHNYFCGSGPVLDDISLIINEGSPPEERPNIRRQHGAGNDPDYYLLLERSDGFSVQQIMSAP